MGARPASFVRPSIAAAVAVAAALTLLAPIGSAADAKGPSGKKRACKKKRGKRVCKLVVRDRGRVRKATIPRRALTAAFSPLAPARSLAPAAPGPQQPDPDPDPEPLGTYLAVESTEWQLELSRPALAAGSQKIEFRNAGEDPHDLKLRADGASRDDPLLDFGELPANSPQPVVLDTSLPAGRYQLWCSLESHETYGMAAELEVR